MGGTTSKPEIESPVFAPDYSKAQFSAEYVQSALDQATQAAQATAKQASEQLGQLGSEVSLLTTGIWSLGSLVVLTGIGFLIYYVLFKLGVVTTFFGISNIAPPAPSNLLLHSATQSGKDLTTLVSSNIKGDTLTVPPSVSKTLAAEGPVSGTALPNPIILNYQFSDSDTNYTYSITDDSATVIISPSSNPGTATGPSTVPPSTQKATAPVSSSWYSSLFAGSGSTGTLVSSMLDATVSSVVKSTSAPLSSGSSGAYGMQWWMFIKDWNYGYGKDKQVLIRADPTNSQILNPSVSLHPTDNSLRVSVSIFPDDSGSSSKTQPAPAGHSGSTDDVFICEVPNLPLQDWFSISMTVFERNLDIYIDGKLVKSCFLPGVPKPASGDITLAGNGGFSGSLCGFTHYSRMLTPSDASSFYAAGTSCKSSTGPTTASNATGYSVKFGVYDTVGKKIQEYTF